MGGSGFEPIQHPRDRVGRFTERPMAEIPEAGDLRVQALPKAQQTHRPRPSFIVTHYRDDSEESWRRVDSQGELHDSERGDPALIAFRPDGSMALQAHYQHGQLGDSGDSPAVVRFRQDGSVANRHHLYRGAHQDVVLRDGSREPAICSFHPNGVVHTMEYFSMGRRHDPADGMAAMRRYDERGRLIEEVHYRYGERATTAGPA
jgi:hypothetical protein